MLAKTIAIYTFFLGKIEKKNANLIDVKDLTKSRSAWLCFTCLMSRIIFNVAGLTLYEWRLLDELGVRRIIHGKALKIYFGGKCSARRAESTYLAAASLAIGLATLAAKSLITRRYHEAHQ